MEHVGVDVSGGLQLGDFVNKVLELSTTPLHCLDPVDLLLVIFHALFNLCNLLNKSAVLLVIYLQLAHPLSDRGYDILLIFFLNILLFLKNNEFYSKVLIFFLTFLNFPKKL